MLTDDIKKTYENLMRKIVGKKFLNQHEIVILNTMKNLALKSNEKMIIKEKRITPTMSEVKEMVKKVEKKSDAEIARDEMSLATIDHIFSVCKLGKVKANTPEQIFEVGQKYFELCEQQVMTPTSSGLARVLGLTRKELLEIVKGEKRVLNQEAYIDLWQLLEMYDEAMMKQGKVNAIVGIFNQKNNHGWVDKVEVVRGASNEQTDEEIKKKYADVIDIE